MQPGPTKHEIYITTRKVRGTQAVLSQLHKTTAVQPRVTNLEREENTQRGGTLVCSTVCDSKKSVLNNFAVKFLQQLLQQLTASLLPHTRSATHRDSIIYGDM